MPLKMKPSGWRRWASRFDASPVKGWHRQRCIKKRSDLLPDLSPCSVARLRALMHVPWSYGRAPCS